MGAIAIYHVLDIDVLLPAFCVQKMSSPPAGGRFRLERQSQRDGPGDMGGRLTGPVSQSIEPPPMLVERIRPLSGCTANPLSAGGHHSHLGPDRL